jgi:hypothetical protein
MPKQQLSEDRDYAKAIETGLVPILAGQDFPAGPNRLPVIVADETGAEVNVVETYEEAGVLGNRGLVLQMSDGAQVRLTIHAYTPAGAR